MIRVIVSAGEAWSEIRTDAPYSPDVLDDLVRHALEATVTAAGAEPEGDDLDDPTTWPET